MTPAGYKMALRLHNKIAVVTGSSSGLGRAIALAYAREGATVVCADLNEEARAEVAAEGSINTDEAIRQSGGRAIFVKTDVSLSQDFEALVQKTAQEFGRLDILVNNAGISVESRRPPAGIHETPEEVWDTTMAVNVKSVFLGSKYAVAQMLRQDAHSSGHRGWIINMSSIYGLVAGRHNVSYATSKAAVVNLTRQVALDYADQKIHCNAICPGYTKTAIFANTIKGLHDENDIEAKHPLGGTGTPEDIVGAAIFLASDEAAWITGVSLPVDGGFTAQ
ncbi:NAD(P)-binding protein [Xylariaceae sp. FL0662B]|nr:NAD(P)-binding protein [Xylariaceae sp. FL0662B]